MLQQGSWKTGSWEQDWYQRSLVQQGASQGLLQHKRNATSEGAVPAPKRPKQKPLQLAASMPTPDTLEDALKIIDRFKAEQTELVRHIAKTDPDNVRAPPIIRALMRQGEQGLSVLATVIQKGMNTAYSRLNANYSAANYKRGSYSSDDFSKAMLPYLRMIKELLKIDDDELTKLRLSYDILFELKEKSQGPFGVEDAAEADERDSDEPADELLSNVIQSRKEAGDMWDWKGDLKGLQDEAKSNDSFGIEPWFPKSIAALSAIIAGVKASEAKAAPGDVAASKKTAIPEGKTASGAKDQEDKGKY